MCNLLPLGAAFFAAELLPVVAVLLGALPRREPRALPELLPLLAEAARVRDAVRVRAKVIIIIISSSSSSNYYYYYH